MKAIQTRYYGPGSVRGSRIAAFDSDGNRVVIPYPHEIPGREEAVHRAAAEALCAKMGWTGCLVGGSIKGGWVFVWVECDNWRVVGAREVTR